MDVCWTGDELNKIQFEGHFAKVIRGLTVTTHCFPINIWQIKVTTLYGGEISESDVTAIGFEMMLDWEENTQHK